jgi:hypothetical protein
LKWLADIQLTNTGGDTASNLLSALHSPWVIEGGGAFSFPFAFHSGIFVPVFFVLGSTGAMPYMTVALSLILLPRRGFSPTSLIAWSLVFSTLALSAEHYFAVIWVGIFLAIGITILRRHRRCHFLKAEPMDTYSGDYSYSFSNQEDISRDNCRLFIPPRIAARMLTHTVFLIAASSPTAHMGSLSDSIFATVCCCRARTVLLLFPLVMVSLRRRYMRQSWFWVGLGFSAILSLLFVLFIEYGVDRSSTRFPATALWTWLVLGIPYLWYTYWKSKRFTRLAISLGYLITVTGGIVIFAFQLLNLPFMQYTYFINQLDASFNRDYWNKLPEAVQVLDPEPSRAASVFGRISKAHASIYEPLPEWEALIAQPDPSRIAQAGFGYVYLDRKWWESLTPAQQDKFNQPCVDILDDCMISNIDSAC